MIKKTGSFKFNIIEPRSGVLRCHGWAFSKKKIMLGLMDETATKYTGTWSFDDALKRFGFWDKSGDTIWENFGTIS